MTAVWPDCSAASTPGSTVRDQLDYLVWIAEALEPVGFHATDEVDLWRPRVDRAYLALIDAMVPGHGDPLPPDVPPSIRPGTWPDVPAATFPGMTVRHQLTVIRTVSRASRENTSFPHQPADVAAWAARVQTAYDALDHGPALAMPAEARTQPPPPPPPRKKRPAARPPHGGGPKPPKPKKSPPPTKPKVASRAKASKPPAKKPPAKKPKKSTAARRPATRTRVKASKPKKKRR